MTRPNFTVLLVRIINPCFFYCSYSAYCSQICFRPPFSFWSRLLHEKSNDEVSTQSPKLHRVETKNIESWNNMTTKIKLTMIWYTNDNQSRNCGWFIVLFNDINWVKVYNFYFLWPFWYFEYYYYNELKYQVNVIKFLRFSIIKFSFWIEEYAEFRKWHT